MPPRSLQSPPAAGRSLADDRRRRLQESASYREVHAELAAFERLARVVIARRAELGLSQRELAKRMGTTASVISRIESGQHPTSVRTLKRLAAALDGSAVVGFRFDAEVPEPGQLIEL
jgi:ribosome-binding protein aMBF1 (putative translation factor)